MSAIELAYKASVRPVIFRRSVDDAEIAHQWGVEQLKRLQASPFLTWLARHMLVYHHPMLTTNVFGLDFANPLGLAAGYDKTAQLYWSAIPSCGWGFCEIGGITQHAQPGNERPRMRRDSQRRALWNCMGFNNPGADAVAWRMGRLPRSVIPVGLNLAKSKRTAVDDAPSDYAYTTRQLWRHVDFLVINASSPNTPGVRQLQDRERLDQLVGVVQGVNTEMAEFYRCRPKPVGFKLSPDETDEQYADAVTVARARRVDFIILTNTTVARDQVAGWGIPADRGGVSGRPVADRARRVLRQFRRELHGEIRLIGVGGISNGDDLYKRILDGADLCQVYTAWPFEGPDFVKRALRTLVQRCRSAGFVNVRQAVGQAVV